MGSGLESQILYSKPRTIVDKIVDAGKSSSFQFQRIPCLCSNPEAGVSGITRSQAGAWERAESYGHIANCTRNIGRRAGHSNEYIGHIADFSGQLAEMTRQIAELSGRTAELSGQLGKMTGHFLDMPRQRT
uniref:Methyl-accepting chemotaxis protein (MCP) signalling domain-containing protein n=1 Tax=Candidatus Kentrum sp. SD TaxID=2126332 RepID=A0A451BSB4_9GAMM|nr:MAG: hypothetical protein BECKSD772D_GA0070982_12461 [Candidatus Kentron sp. SD]